MWDNGHRGILLFKNAEWSKDKELPFVMSNIFMWWAILKTIVVLFRPWLSQMYANLTIKR